jgi:membrane protease YdiL (CAAX protease family)
MAPNPFKISTLTLCATLTAVIVIELGAGWAFHWIPISRFEKLGSVRLIQTAAMIWLVYRLDGGLGVMGWAPATWMTGLKKGAVWSLGFAAAAALAMALAHWLGHHPLRWIRSPLPSHLRGVITLFTVGALVAPVAEEICFRGILYAYFRRWGVMAALVASTTIFVLLHFNRIPITQLVGGIVFALAYETSRNLMSPITIHALGNLALFTLSLPIFQH